MLKHVWRTSTTCGAYSRKLQVRTVVEDNGGSVCLERAGSAAGRTRGTGLSCLRLATGIAVAS
jgi:hypothetical protein